MSPPLVPFPTSELEANHLPQPHSLPAAAVQQPVQQSLPVQDSSSSLQGVQEQGKEQEKVQEAEHEKVQVAEPEKVQEAEPEKVQEAEQEKVQEVEQEKVQEAEQEKEQEKVQEA